MLPQPPLLQKDDSINIKQLYAYMYDLLKAFPNAAGEAIEATSGQGGDSSLDVVDAPASVTYTPGSSISVDGVIFGHVDISFVLPNKAIQAAIAYREQGVVNFKLSFGLSPYRVINLKIGGMYEFKVAGVAANGKIADAFFSTLTTVNLPTAGFTVKAPDDAEYIVAALNAGLTSERVATDTATITWSFATIGQAQAQIPNDAVTYAKIQNVTASRLLGRGSAAGAGDTQELTAGDGLTIASTVLQLSPAIATFTITATGFTTTVTGTARYVLLGTIVILFIPSLTGTSNATTLTLTGLPSAIQPTQTSFEELRVADNGVDILGIARLNSGSTTIDLFSSIALGVWTIVGTKTIYPLYICYHLS